MSATSDLPTLIERWFTDRLMRHRGASANTIASYRDTFRLLFAFAQDRLRRPPSKLSLTDLDAPFVCAFLDDLEARRSATPRTRNLRLTAIRSFFRYASFEAPAHSGHIQRVLAIPTKRCDKRQLHFLTRAEINAILSCPDQATWIGRRDHTLLLLAVQKITAFGAGGAGPRRRNPRSRRPRAMRRQGTQGAMYALDKDGSTYAPGVAKGASQARSYYPVPERAWRSAQRRRSPVAAEQICGAGTRWLRLFAI